jgi:hypothetical protein
MRTGLSLLVGVLAAFGLEAATITCSNDPATPAQYTSLQAAIDAANEGDTILVSGSITSYGIVELWKRVTVFGPGYNPNKERPVLAQIAHVAILRRQGVLTSPDGCRVAGVRVDSITGGEAGTVADVTIERCRVDSLAVYHSTGWVVKHNLIGRLFSYRRGSISSPVVQTLTVANNIIGIGVDNALSDFYSTPGDIIFANNLFFGEVGVICESCSGVDFRNNLFYSVSPCPNDGVNFDFCT